MRGRQILSRDQAKDTINKIKEETMGRGRTAKALLALVLAAGAGSVVLAQPAAAQEIQLKLAHFLPTANGMHKDFMVPWAHDLETCSGGKVKVTIYPGGTQLGNIGRLYDEVSSGVVDIAHGLAGVPAGRLNRLRLMEVPFTIKTANAGVRALWDLHDEIKPDFPNLKILGAAYDQCRPAPHGQQAGAHDRRSQGHAHPVSLRSGQGNAELSRRGAGRPAAGRGL